jgi:hypothetical protein
VCDCAHNKSYEETHREARREAKRQRRQENAERNREYNSAYWKAHKEEHREHAKLYRERHPETSKLHYEVNREVRVGLDETCTGETYDTQAVQTLLTRALTQEAARQFGAGYTLTGEVQVTEVTVTPSRGTDY